MFGSQGREDRRRSGDEKFRDHGMFSRVRWNSGDHANSTGP